MLSSGIRNSYDITNSATHTLGFMGRTIDDGFLLSGALPDPNPREVVLIKLNANAELEWGKSFQDSTNILGRVAV